MILPVWPSFYYISPAVLFYHHPWLSCAPFHLCKLDGSIHKENNCPVVCGNGADWSGAEMARESANCDLLHNNIVMLDYPSSCCQSCESPWTYNPAEEQPTVNGIFHRNLLSASSPECHHPRRVCQALCLFNYFGQSALLWYNDVSCFL